MYYIKQDGIAIKSSFNLSHAIKIAENLFRSLAGETCTNNEITNTNTCKSNKGSHSNNNTQSTVSVEDQDGKVVASLSTYRIIGAFTKEKWGEAGSDRVIILDTVDFDATDYVLLMPYEDLIELEDSAEETDAIGAAHIGWVGPRDVSITTAICAYFGVDDVGEIAIENFNYVQSRITPQKVDGIDVVLSVKMKVQVHPGANDEMLDALNWSFIRCPAGAIIRSAEVALM